MNLTLKRSLKNDIKWYIENLPAASLKDHPRQESYGPVISDMKIQTVHSIVEYYMRKFQKNGYCQSQIKGAGRPPHQRVPSE